MPPEMLIYHWWAANFHFTPRQVREDVDLDSFHWLPVIEEAVSLVKARLEKEARTKSDNRPTRRVLGR